MGDIDCPFCNPPDEEVVLANDLCYARYDKYPVSPGHLLLIPYRRRLLRRNRCGNRHPSRWTTASRRYNVGVNVGPAAGQTVMHLHVHLIPRYAGDVEDPRGGVRGAVPEKRRYE